MADTIQNLSSTDPRKELTKKQICSFNGETFLNKKTMFKKIMFFSETTGNLFAITWTKLELQSVQRHLMRRTKKLASRPCDTLSKKKLMEELGF